MRAISWVTGMESMERWGGKADILYFELERKACKHNYERFGTDSKEYWIVAPGRRSRYFFGREAGFCPLARLVPDTSNNLKLRQPRAEQPCISTAIVEMLCLRCSRSLSAVPSLSIASRIAQKAVLKPSSTR